MVLDKDPPLKHIKLWYFPREALKLVESSSESVLFLTQDKKAITIQDRVKNRCELLREPQRSFCWIEKLFPKILKRYIPWDQTWTFA